MQIATIPDPPNTVALAGQSAPAVVGWADENPLLHIDADTDLDAARALGMAHGLRHGWSMVLWRQTARGRLTEWLTHTALPFDRHARQMGWARAAQDHLQRLPDADRAWLAAYTEGVNAAFATEHVQRHPPFATLNVSPQPWAPWHTLAVEHLLTWMATEQPPLPNRAPQALHSFAEVDAELRTWLGLHGWHHSMAWILADQPGPQNAPSSGYRLMRGHSSDPLIAPVWHTSPTDTAWIATVPGTRWTLAHHTTHTHRMLLPRSTATWTRDSTNTPVTQRTERIRMRTGHETLVGTAMTDTGRFFAPTPADIAGDSTLADSAWVLTLPYRGAVPAQSERFPQAASLPHHTPLTVEQGETLTITGPTTPIRTAAGDSVGVVLSTSSWRTAWADRFHAYTDSDVPIYAWAVDDTSTWAQQAVQPLQETLAAHPPVDSLHEIAATFVRNWEGVYEPSSVGAALFTTWWHEMRDLHTTPSALDTTAYFASIRYRRGFARAVDRLRHKHGPDVRRWQWETVQPHRFTAPLWGDAEHLPAHLYPDAAHDTPDVSIPGRSHISTLAPGPSPDATPPAPGYHLHWIGTDGMPPYYRHTDLSRTLADRLMATPDSRTRAHRPVAEPSTRIHLTPP